MNTVIEPALKRAADAASAGAQRTFMRLNILQLTLLSTTAIVSGWSPAQSTGQRRVAIAVFILMVAAIAVGLALKIGRFDDKWFRLRAIAENVKSAMWRFAMARPGSAAGSERRFLDAERQIQERFTNLTAELARHRQPGEDITRWMLTTQQLSLEAKVGLYRQDRVADQVKWYQDKALHNARRETQWQWTVFVLEFIAILYAALQAWRLWNFNIVAGLAAISTAFVAWSQTKRHSDLANSYGVAVEDLRRISAASSGVLTEAVFDTLVLDVEAAISREHSMWLARRTP